MESDWNEKLFECGSGDSNNDNGADGGEEVINNVNEEGRIEKDVDVLSAADIRIMEFRTDEDAYDLYVTYAKCIGFGVRKGDVARDDDGNKIRRRFFCNRAGLREEKHYERDDRKREHRAETRTKCLAKLSVYLDTSTSRWKVRKLVETHNHDLTPRPFVHLITSHRQISEAEKAQIDSMHKHGIPKSQIISDNKKHTDYQDLLSPC